MNEVQKKFLQNAIVNNRVPQAIIFAGQVGLGKKQVALDFVKELHNGVIQEQDLIIIEPQEKEIQIDQIRELQQALNFRPQFASFKTVLIVQAHSLNKLAQNCFLKTLEEPQSKAVFILITAYPEMLLPTIRSRCALLKFFPSSPPKADSSSEAQSLLAKDLASRFAFVEKFAKKSSPQDLQAFLGNLVKHLRGLLLADPVSNYRIKEKIEKAENIKFLLSTTNINQRLALENLMLEL